MTMDNLGKTVVLAMLFFPIAGLAINCSSGDSECKINQSRLTAMEKSGVRPSEVLASPGTATTNSNKKDSSLIKEPRPFKVPLPLSSKPKMESDPTLSENEDSSITEHAPAKEQPKLNIFAPNTNSSQSQEEPEFTFQPPRSPLQLQPITNQPTGIQYH